VNKSLMTDWMLGVLDFGAQHGAEGPHALGYTEKNARNQRDGENHRSPSSRC